MPRLTVTVPTYNRPHMLPRALDSLQKQIVPVNVIVADDGDHPEETSKILADLMPNAKHVVSRPFDHSWPNWKAGMKEARTEYVSWLQDDDIVKPNYSDRIIRAFDKFPDANVWFARLVIGIGDGMAVWNCGNGPWVPVDMMNGEVYSWAEGSILASSAYFTSWSLAPAFAFRNGAAFHLALDRMPDHCDIFVERLLPAMTANGGPFISDPTLAGLWMQHDEHLSTQQHKDQPRMTKEMIRVLDLLLDNMDGWKRSMTNWAQLIPTGTVLQWIGNLDHVWKEGGRSRHAKNITEALINSLEGRIKLVSGPRRTWNTWVHKVANVLTGA